MANYKEYVIVSGDNLTKIAKNFDTTVDELVKLNNIANPDLIYAGDTLKIPVAEEEANAATGALNAATATASTTETATEEAEEETTEESKNLFQKIADKLTK